MTATGNVWMEILVGDENMSLVEGTLRLLFF